MILSTIAIEVNSPAFVLWTLFLGALAAWPLRTSLRQAIAAGTTEYLLTDRRALVRTPGWGGRATVESFPPATLGELIRRQRPDSSGDLIFAEVFGSDRRYGPVAFRGFLGLADVRAVEGMVRSTLIDRQEKP